MGKSEIKEVISIGPANPRLLPPLFSLFSFLISFSFFLQKKEKKEEGKRKKTKEKCEGVGGELLLNAEIV